MADHDELDALLLKWGIPANTNASAEFRAFMGRSAGGQDASVLGKRTTSAVTASSHELPDAGCTSDEGHASGPGTAMHAVANGGDARMASGGCSQLLSTLPLRAPGSGIQGDPSWRDFSGLQLMAHPSEAMEVLRELVEWRAADKASRFIACESNTQAKLWDRARALIGKREGGNGFTDEQRARFHHPPGCEHVWDGPEWTSVDGRTVSATCSKCECRAIDHSARLG